MRTRSGRFDIEGWLGADHGLTPSQILQLGQIADEIYVRYCTPEPTSHRPGRDEAELATETADEREAALIAAHRVILEGPAVVDELGSALRRARGNEAKALAGLRQAALMLVGDLDTQAGFARRAGVDRMTVREWLGLR